MIKKINFLLIVVFCFILNINVFAKTVTVSGTDIYENGTEGGASFNKDTNTLELNNYSGSSIIFDGFSSEKININVKGTNYISSESITTNSVGLGKTYNANDTLTVNINGEDNSKLYISNFANGIYFNLGSMEIHDTYIDFNNVSNCITNGTFIASHLELSSKTTNQVFNVLNLNMNDSKVKAEDSKGVFTSLDDIDLFNVEIEVQELSENLFKGVNVTLEDVTITGSDIRDIFYLHGESEFNNLTVDVYNFDHFVYCTGILNISDSDITLRGGSYLGDSIIETSYPISFKNTDMNIKNIEGFINTAGVDIEFIGCNITIKYNADTNLFIDVINLDIINSTFDVEEEIECAFSASNINIENSTIECFLVYYVFVTENLTIKHSNIHTETCDVFATNDGTAYIDTVLITDGSIINIEAAMGQGAVTASNFIIKDSKFKAHNNLTILQLNNKLEADNSELYLASTSGAPIIISSSTDKELDEVVKLTNCHNKDPELYSLNKSRLENAIGDSYYYSYFTEDPEASYPFFEAMNSSISRLVNIVPDNPNTFDISVLYIIIGILSVVGISIAKFDLDLLKNNK